MSKHKKTSNSVHLTVLRNRLPVYLPPFSKSQLLAPPAAHTGSVHEAVLPLLTDAFFKTGLVDELPASAAYLINRHSPVILQVQNTLAKVRPFCVCFFSPATPDMIFFWVAHLCVTHTVALATARCAKP
jgi:hypothetical protein